MDYQNVQDSVDKVLRENYILDPPVNIQDLISNYGLTLQEIDFGTYKSSVSGFLDFEKKAIYVNKDDSDVRKIFTAAHELGHWILHKNDFDKDPSKYSVFYRRPLGQYEDNKYEKEANYFAAHLLVPKEFLDKYKDLDIKTKAIIFGVSSEVIGYRTKDGN